jgi:hypothetical protein
MKERIISIVVTLSALLVSSFLAGMLVVPTGWDGIAQAQTTTEATGNFSEEDLNVIKESLNDAREAIHTNNSGEAVDELETAQRSIITLSNQSQAEAQAPQAEDNAAATIAENQTDVTTTQNLTAQDLDTVQQSLNSVRDAIHTNNSDVAIEELIAANEELSTIENETAG